VSEQRRTLPILPTPLVGRAREVAEVQQRLLTPEVRLLTLTGTGGTGKTRLALAVAAAIDAHFPQGVWFINLALLQDPALVIATIAQSLGIKEQPDELLLNTLARELSGWRALLNLDNFEQVVTAASEAASLLERCSHLKLLVTSRTALSVYGEHQYQVPPLSLPELGHLPPLDELARSEAVALFLQRARAAHAAFHATEEDAPAIAEICTRLDGLPLAIELAAARIRLMPPQALLARLSRRLDVLTGSVRNVPLRQQTLRNTIDWSYGLLDSAEQALFRRLSVFAGGCTFETAATVCGDPDARDGLSESLILEELASLVDKSLLEQRGGLPGQPRFVMLETIREYALELLEDSGDGAQLRDAHARLFLAIAEEAEQELLGPRQAEWFARLDAERENLRAALAWTLTSHPSETGVRIAAALFRFWDSRGQLAEGKRWLDRAVAASTEVGPVWRGRVLNAAGNLARRHGELQQATVWHEESLTIRRALGDTSGVAAALANLGNIAFDLAAYERSASLSQEALELYRSVDDRKGIALALNNLGIAMRELGQPDQAVALHDEALAVRREIGDRGGIAQALENLGRAALEQGDHRRAAALLREGLALWHELGNRVSLPMALEDLGRAAALDGHFGRAARLWGVANALRTSMGLPMPIRRRERYAASVANARSRLGDAQFDQAWSAGQALSTDAAIEYALTDEEPSSVAGARGRATHSPLSPREHEVASLIARGLTSKEIAEELVVSEKTVDTHADHIRQKLGLRSRAEIAAWITSQSLGRP
jgi:non-specific serine/threonine protein kinase